MILKNNEQTLLKPVLSFGDCCSNFAGEPGTYKCKIHVDKGEVQFGHGAYNCMTGCWDDKPDGEECSKMLLREGETKDFEFTCGTHYGQADNIWIYNHSYLKPASFICTYARC